MLIWCGQTNAMKARRKVTSNIKEIAASGKMEKKDHSHFAVTVRLRIKDHYLQEKD